jgi:hypothetical protein
MLMVPESDELPELLELLLEVELPAQPVSAAALTANAAMLITAIHFLSFT